MHTHRWLKSEIARSLALAFAVCFSFHTTHAQASKTTPPPASTAPSITSDTDVANTREELLKLLRISPTLTEVVAADPSLLANQDYVARSNPELAHFLQIHPEVARNPDFYLFADLPHNGGRRVERLERRVWNGAPLPDQNNSSQRFINELGPFLVFVLILAAFLWLIRVLLVNRRWGRIFRLQTEVHGRLIEKLGSSQELLAYMSTDAGKRFLEAAPIPVDFEKDERVPAVLSRVLTPLSIGIVLTLLGSGLLFLRHSLSDISDPLLVFGVIVLMPGIGFIISAGITWLLAARLGLMPDRINEVETRER